MSRPWPSDGGTVGAARVGGRVRADAHGVQPIRPIPVRNAQGDRAAQRLAMADSGQDFRGVPFDGHAAAASVAELATREIAREVIDGQAETGRHAIDDGDECLPMRLTGCKKSKHWLGILSKFSKCA